MNEDISMLKEISDRLIARTNLDFKRYLFSNIDWRNRFICLKMLEVLERAELVSLLKTEKDKLKSMSSPEKIYCDNVNLMRALVPRADVGTMRETFFVNQLRAAGHTVSSPAKGDFLVDGRWLLEVGGKGKTFKQIKDEPDSFIAYDDVEIGTGNKIPLWLFGFLY